MRKLFVLILLVSIVAMAGWIFSVLTNSASFDTPKENVEVGRAENGTQTITILPENQPDTVRVPLVTGSMIDVNNFAKLQDVNSVGSNMYHLNTARGYQILFNQTRGSFAVDIHQRPILVTRDRAVQDLAEMLGVNLKDLCLFNVYISTTFDFDPEMSGKNIGIGQC